MARSAPRRFRASTSRSTASSTSRRPASDRDRASGPPWGPRPPGVMGPVRISRTLALDVCRDSPTCAPCAHPPPTCAHPGDGAMTPAGRPRHPRLRVVGTARYVALRQRWHDQGWRADDAAARALSLGPALVLILLAAPVTPLGHGPVSIKPRCSTRRWWRRPWEKSIARARPAPVIGQLSQPVLSLSSTALR